ncbi:sulfotransferase family protein [Thiorhodovibrio frisius]|uniref:hypothetical protein n=1 Tax=Thiorhodovibrio frisius TaxID=631362 RepID=UPI000255DD6C|nr:hypothetical protein [Thiorhodovibrio frisius]
MTTATESNRQRPSQRDCTTLVVLGAFSSGTTALTGYLERLGAYSCPPHLQLNDPMTPSSYEPTALRAALLEAVDEQQLCRRAQRGEGFADWFQSWWQDQCAQARSNGSTQLVLKHPLLAFVMPEMAAVCNPRWLIMMRPFSAIETSRQRRGWGAPYGAAGASRIYQAIFEHLLAQPDDALMLNFEHFRQDPASRKRLIDWLGLAPSAQGQVQADAWVRG